MLKRGISARFKAPKKHTRPERLGPKPGKALPRATLSPTAEPRFDLRAKFPIVGIGASAGGLEALEQFLGPMPKPSGLAFVVIQHLDPTHEGMMPQLLQRATWMKVCQATHRTKVRPDCVYVIPPNKDMSILGGVLHLSEPAAPRGLRLPIDFFLRSLAADQQAQSIGVILSGMGSDGTLGLRSIKEGGGLTLVQAPKTAKFDSMPRSAIEAGLADIVAPVQELPSRILEYVRRAQQTASGGSGPEDESQSALEKAVILLRAHTGHDFSLYKRNTLYRRMERRMGIHQIGDMAEYVQQLQENSQELDLLFKELLIGVTKFFRDPAVWQQLLTEGIPTLLAHRSSGHALRAWVPGCSTGEEAYSMAMVFKEALDHAKLKGKFALQIFATDLDRDAIDKARQGLFPENIAADVSPERLERFFTKEDGGHRVRNLIREMVIFAPQNLVMDPPFTKLDILSCRNLLIYLAPEMQKKLMSLFHHSLNPGGILILGSAESMSGFAGQFEPIGKKSRMFRRCQPASRQEPVEFPASFAVPLPGEALTNLQPKAPLTFKSLADQLILKHYCLPAVLVSDKGDILYVSGKTGKYLEPAAGKANWNIFVMAREGLRYPLAAALQKALRQKGRVALQGLKLRTGRGEESVDVAIEQIAEPGPLEGLVVIVFTDVPPCQRRSKVIALGTAHARHTRLAELEQELWQLRAEARDAQEEMQTAQEEFRSAHEELQSTNEELQSTNEELTTSREEMQSLNEELQTVNAELQAKVDELSLASDDMKNLLNSTDIATLFLDNQLHVRRFTPQTAKIIKLIPGDAGRPITDLASELHYSTLAEDARDVLETLEPAEKQIDTRDGSWFTVRIMPYRTLDDRIDGVVITFADITVAKNLELQLRAQQAGLQKRIGDQATKLARRGG